MVLAVNPPQLSTTLTTVLVIDDNDEDRKYWCEALKHSAHNYTVLEASNGQSGLNLCRSQRVDCIVLDLDMPESGFYVLFDLIRDRTRPQIAVVILTHLLVPNLWRWQNTMAPRCAWAKRPHRLRTWRMRFRTLWLLSDRRGRTLLVPPR